MQEEAKPFRKLQNLMVESRVERRELAKYTDINYFTLCKYISGERPITPHVAAKLIAYFSASLRRELPADYLAQIEPENELENYLMMVPVYTVMDDKPIDITPDRAEGNKLLAKDNFIDGEYFYLCFPKGVGYTGLTKETHLLCKKQDFIEDSKTAVLIYEDNLLIRTVRWLDGRIIMCPVSSSSDVEIVSPNKVHILAEVVRMECEL
jgi:hypothetical protein